MKTERRHELQTNMVADWLGREIEKIKPYSKAIAGVVCSLIVIGLVYAVVSQQQARQAGEAWQDYLVALMQRDQDDMASAMAEVAEKQASSTAGQWARLTEADLDLQRGSARLFTDRDDALSILKKAQASYEQVEKTSQNDPILLEKARFGLAQALECQGQLSEAREKYEAVIKTNSKSALGKLAADRMQVVSNPQVADFLAWFEKQEPPPVGKPGSKLPGTTPFSLDDLPARPDISLPPGADPTTEKPATPTKEDEPATPPADKPTDKPEDKPADKPADKPEDKPADKPAEKPADKPADDAKPSEKPADSANPSEPAKPADPAKPAEKTEDKPADKPAEKPEEKPTEKPAEKP